MGDTVTLCGIDRATGKTVEIQVSKATGAVLVEGTIGVSGGALDDIKAVLEDLLAATKALTWSSAVLVNVSSGDQTFSAPYPSGVYVAIPGDIKFDGFGLTGATMKVGVGPVPIRDLTKIYAQASGTTASISYAGKP